MRPKREPALPWSGHRLYTGHVVGPIRVDRDGLTVISGRRLQLMAWSSVQEIWWGAGRRGKFSYLVKSDVPTFQIRWTAGPQAAHAASPPEDGSVPIGPDELAALVAARCGQVIRLRL
jgi:hypothetical protein